MASRTELTVGTAAAVGAAAMMGTVFQNAGHLDESFVLGVTSICGGMAVLAMLSVILQCPKATRWWVTAILPVEAVLVALQASLPPYRQEALILLGVCLVGGALLLLFLYQSRSASTQRYGVYH